MIAYRQIKLQKFYFNEHKDILAWECPKAFRPYHLVNLVSCLKHGFTLIQIIFWKMQMQNTKLVTVSVMENGQDKIDLLLRSYKTQQIQVDLMGK